MPDYPGAKVAIQQRLTANWTTTPVVMQNKDKPEGWTAAWPPVDADAVLLPWTLLEILSTGSEIAGSGKRGNHLWHYFGNILVHVFVPVGEGQERADQYANQIGEIFRAAEFYNGTPGYCVRTLAPSVDDGGTSDDDGDWFRVTMSVDFTYWHRG
ncbi:hypothetical protein [Mesorhizobium sp. M0968]|uniref:hypothetical protein n=1 Tax=Mesorhizobium sp. M0968 TaxID=2957037 RepID=UPI00333DD6B3